MNDKDTSRRRFLTGMATAVSGIALSGGLVSYASPVLAQTAAASLDDYSTLFFDEVEWRFIVAACDRLIPADDEGPGALIANVPVFIDQQMQTDYAGGGLWYMSGPFLPSSAPEFGYQYKFTPRDIYRFGIADVDTWCMDKDGKVFADLEKARQTEILKQLEDGSIELPTVPARVFFGQLLSNTREGFFADPMYGGNRDMVGWKMIGFPGARGDYGDFIHQHNRPYTQAPVSIKSKRG